MATDRTLVRRVAAPSPRPAPLLPDGTSPGRRVIAQREDTPQRILSKRNPTSGSPIAATAGSITLKYLQQALWKIVAWSIVASLVVHLIVGALSAVVIGQRVVIVVTPVQEAPEEDVRLVFPEPPKPPKENNDADRYIRTAPDMGSEEAPKKPDFISDKNTVASAIDAPDPGGDPTLPSMKGSEGPNMELTRSRYEDGDLKDGAAAAPPPSPTPPSAPPPPAPPEPAERRIVKQEESAVERMMREAEAAAPPIADVRLSDPAPTPPSQPLPRSIASQTPAMEAPPTLQSTYMPQSDMRTTRGGVAERGDRNSVNAARTIAGTYYKMAQDAIGQRWNKELGIKNVNLLPGRVILKVVVDRAGHVRPEDVSVALDKGGPVLKETAFSAVFNTKLPPLPDDMLPILEKGRFEMMIHFILD